MSSVGGCDSLARGQRQVVERPRAREAPIPLNASPFTALELDPRALALRANVAMV